MHFLFCLHCLLLAGKLLKFMRQGGTTASDDRNESVIGGGGLSLEEGYLLQILNFILMLKLLYSRMN